MLSSVKKISVFLASPGDVTIERSIVKDVCDEITLDLGRILGFILELLRWETHASPGIDESAQHVINRSIGQDYNIFLGILGRKFGTPTKSWRSGTEEEFRIAHENSKISNSPRIMFCFSRILIDPYMADLSQFETVKSFQGEIAQLGVLYWEFTDPIEFKIILRRHLIKEIKELIDSDLTLIENHSTLQVDTFDPLTNYNLVRSENPDVSGFVLMNHGVDMMNLAVKDLATIVQRMKKLGDSAKRFTRELIRTKSKNSENQTKMLQEISLLFFQYDAYIGEFRSTIPSLRDHFEDALLSQSRAISILSLSKNLANTEIENLFSTLDMVANNVDIAHSGIENMNNSFIELPLLGSEYEVRRKLVVALNNDLLGLLAWTKKVISQFKIDIVSDVGMQIA